MEVGSLRAARRLEAALRELHPEVIADDGRYCVTVRLPPEEDVSTIFAALREHAGSGLARISFGGESYTLDPLTA